MLVTIHNLKNRLRKKLSKDQVHNLDRLFNRNKVMGLLTGIFFGRNLTALSVIYNTDKWGDWGGHYYTQHYQRHLREFKYKRINLLEIGVGGYERPDRGGNSLRMWKRYFPFGRIFSIDIYDKSLHEERRIKIFKGSQVDHEFLDMVVEKIKRPFDIIIDDGSHINEHVIDTFEYLFPKLRKGGIYVVEDVQTSYRDEYGGNSKDLDNSNTIMNFFKKLTDCVNYKEFHHRNDKAGYYNKNIIAVHFYESLIFVYKSKN